MVTLAALWLPIVLASVLVFVVSSIVWMALPHHRSDTAALPDEAGVLAALRQPPLKPGLYRFPCAPDMASMKTPEFAARMAQGPVGLLTVRPAGGFDMGKPMALWFVYVLAVTVFVAYLTGHTLPAGAPYLAVFRVAGTAAFLGHAGGHLPSAIWWGKPWSVAWKEVFDGLLYALVSAGIFGWLWPR